MDELGTAEEGGGRRGNGENEVGESSWSWKGGWLQGSGGSEAEAGLGMEGDVVLT